MTFSRLRLTLLTTGDLATMLFLLVLSLLNILFAPAIPYWFILVGCNVLFICLIPFFAQKAKETRFRLVGYIRDWYPVPMIFYVFKQTYLMVHPIHPQDYDWLLINIDRWIFGGDPTRWLSMFASPLVTEILQISYACYYLILLSVFFELSFEKRHTEFFLGSFLVVYGFYLSVHRLFPAAGCRSAIYLV